MIVAGGWRPQPVEVCQFEQGNFSCFNLNITLDDYVNPLLFVVSKDDVQNSSCINQ